MNLTRRRLTLAVLAGLAALPATAQADLLDTRVAANQAKKRSCSSGLASGSGAVQRRVTATATGLIRAQLSGSRRGDWDLAVFDAASGRRVAGSAHRGSWELAEGWALKGQRLVVQACRRSGRVRAVRLTARSIGLEGRAKGGKIQLVRIALPTEAARQAVETLGLDLTEHARPGFRDALLYSEDEGEKLRAAGLSYQVLLKDAVAADRRAMREHADTPIKTGVPSGRTDYRHLDDYSMDMKKLAGANGNLVRSIELPHRSIEGRPVEGIEITNGVDNLGDGKPVFLQMGVHHAREWPSGEHAMEWAFELVNEFKAGNQRVRDLLDRARVIVVPIVNPDGFNLSREAPIDVPVGPTWLLAEAVFTGRNFGHFAYKRKNCNVPPDGNPATVDCALRANRFHGVDPNRNYGGFWGGPGAAIEADSDIYRGAGPFSEPETRNVKELVASRQVTTLITNHTYSDLVLRPPGIRAEGEPPDEGVYKALGDAMAAENGYRSQRSYELYDTTGTTEDWTYYNTGGLGFTFEIGPAGDGPTGYETFAGTGFHPPYPLGVVREWHGKYSEGGGNREAYYKALEATADESLHSVITGKAPKGTQLRIRKAITSYTSPVITETGLDPARTFDDVLESTLTVGDAKRFTWHVNPSTRPFAKKDRVFPVLSAAPVEKMDIGAPAVAGERTPAPTIKTFEVTGDRKGAIIAYIDGADGDDWDLYLYEGGSVDPTKEVANSADADADERIVYALPAPGTYTVEARYFSAVSGYSGSIELYGEKPAVQLAATTETWTLSCERDGTVLSSRQVVVERGQKVDVGNACGRGGS